MQIAILGAIGFLALVIFLLDAGMNGMGNARGWLAGISLGCFIALWLMGVK